MNVGKEWSAMDVADLEQGLRVGTSIEETADFLMRSVEEVKLKAKELGLLPQTKRATRVPKV